MLKFVEQCYWTLVLEGNSCSRLLDAVAMGEIPFEVHANAYLDALRALKTVKDKCLGKTREMGWVEVFVYSGMLGHLLLCLGL